MSNFRAKILKFTHYIILPLAMGTQDQEYLQPILMKKQRTDLSI